MMQVELKVLGASRAEVQVNVDGKEMVLPIGVSHTLKVQRTFSVVDAPGPAVGAAPPAPPAVQPK
jgi:hypothetical protein